MAKKLKKKNSRRPEVDSDIEYMGIELNVPPTSLLGYTFFFYGSPKVGKTTAALSWPSPIVIATETKGTKAMKVKHIKCRNWDHIQKALKTLAKKENRKKFKTVIIDTTDLLYKYCFSYCCDKYGFDHPSDQGWGKGWEKISDEFLALILAIFDLNYTLVFISHSKTTQIKADWDEYTRIDPTLAGPGRKVLLPLVDVIVYMTARDTKKGSTRRITTKAAREYEAGDRTQRLTDLELTIPKKKQKKVYDILNILYKKNG